MPKLYKTDVASLADLKVFVTDIRSEADLVDADPLHLAQQLQVPIQCAARPACEFGQLFWREYRRPLMVVGPTQAQDASHGDDEGIVGLSIGYGHRHVDAGGEEAVLSRFARLQTHFELKDSWVGVADGDQEIDELD